MRKDRVVADARERMRVTPVTTSLSTSCWAHFRSVSFELQGLMLLASHHGSVFVPHPFAPHYTGRSFDVHVHLPDPAMIHRGQREL